MPIHLTVCTCTRHAPGGKSIYTLLIKSLSTLVWNQIPRNKSIGGQIYRFLSQYFICIQPACIHKTQRDGTHNFVSVVPTVKHEPGTAIVFLETESASMANVADFKGIQFHDKFLPLCVVLLLLEIKVVMVKWQDWVKERKRQNGKMRMHGSTGCRTKTAALHRFEGLVIARFMMRFHLPHPQ